MANAKESQKQNFDKEVLNAEGGSNLVDSGFLVRSVQT